VTGKEATRLFNNYARAWGYYKKVRGLNAYMNVQGEMVFFIGFENKSVRIFVNDEYYYIS